jgi:Spy/CpxP family protein refolding chaperone
MVFQPSRLVDRRQALALTPDQVSRLEALSQEAERARTQADSVARTLRDQLQELWDAPEPDVAQLRSRAQAAMQAHQTAALASLEAAAKARAVLTAEQRGRVAGWLEGARTGRSMRMRRPMDGPGRPGRRR